MSNFDERFEKFFSGRLLANEGKVIAAEGDHFIDKPEIKQFLVSEIKRERKNAIREIENEIPGYYYNMAGGFIRYLQELRK